MLNILWKVLLPPIMAQQFDLLIIGGGVLGAFHVYHALEKGYRVALLERNSSPQGSSVQNFGQIVPSGMDRKWQQYGRVSLEIYKEIQSKFDISVRQNGSVYIASDEDELLLLEELAQINKDQDYTSQLWTAKECLSRYDGLRSDYCKGGLFFPDEITLEPRVAIGRILAYLVAHRNLQYFPNTLAIGAYIGLGKCVVETSNKDTFYANKVLICNGYEMKTLFPDIYEKSDLVLVKLQMLRLEQQLGQQIPGSILTGRSIRRYESFRECPSYSAVKSRALPDALATDWGIHILFKQAVDGSIILGDSHEYADIKEADTLGTAIKYPLNDLMLEAAKSIFDLQNWNVADAWAGTYTQCKNQDIFQHTIDGQIHLLTGIGGKGMTASAGFAAEHINTLGL